jgi:hypothetical protein
VPVPDFLKPKPTPPATPAPKPPPPEPVSARAVIVYQEKPRRPWGLYVFTAVLVALTVGVVLGQTVAFEPTYRSTANAQTAPTPLLSEPAPASAQPWPDAAHRVTSPLGTARTRILEVAGSSTVLHVRSADLGDKLFDIATTDRSAVPKVTETKDTSRLDLIRTGDTGVVGAEIQLNSKVAWTLRLAGGSSERNLDMQAGGLAGVELTGGSGNVVLQLPKPHGTVRLALAGPIGDLVVTTKAPVRFRFGAAAATVVTDGKPERNVKAGTAVTTAGWRAATDRYDIATSGTVSSVTATS